LLPEWWVEDEWRNRKEDAMSEETDDRAVPVDDVIELYDDEARKWAGVFGVPVSKDEHGADYVWLSLSKLEALGWTPNGS